MTFVEFDLRGSITDTNGSICYGTNLYDHINTGPGHFRDTFLAEGRPLIKERFPVTGFLHEYTDIAMTKLLLGAKADVNQTCAKVIIPPLGSLYGCTAVTKIGKGGE